MQISFVGTFIRISYLYHLPEIYILPSLTGQNLDRYCRHSLRLWFAYHIIQRRSNATFKIFRTIAVKLETDLCSPLWDHDVLTFFALLTLCERNPQFTAKFPSQRAVLHNAFVVSTSKLLKMACYDKTHCTQRTMSLRQIPHPRGYINSSKQNNQKASRDSCVCLKFSVVSIAGWHGKPWN